MPLRQETMNLLWTSNATKVATGVQHPRQYSQNLKSLLERAEKTIHDNDNANISIKYLWKNLEKYFLRMQWRLLTVQKTSIKNVWTDVIFYKGM